MGERGNREDRGSQHEQRRNRPRPVRLEALHAVLDASGDEREPEDEQAVSEHRSDERRLDDPREAAVQGEEGHEQLRQVAERRLNAAGTPGAEAAAELLGRRADEPREQRERDGGRDEADDGGGSGDVGDGRDTHDKHRHAQLQRLSPCQPAGHRATLSARDPASPRSGDGEAIVARRSSRYGSSCG